MNAEARWLTETVGIRPLTDRCVLTVAGDDARSWLNGQITNDVRETKAGDSVYALVINVKGRVLADTWVLDRGQDGLAITLPTANLDAVLAHFDKYIIMEDVELEKTSLAIVSVQGPKASAVVEGLESYAAPQLHPDGRQVIGPSVERMLETLLPRAQTQGGGLVSDEVWDLIRLRNGVPQIHRDFGENTYPQEAGLKERAVSFQKGCYLGQEVVCMLENRGQLNRRLVQLESPDALSLGAGDELQIDGQKVGEITSAVVDGDKAWALGFVKRAFAEDGKAVSSPKGELRVRAVVE